MLAPLLRIFISSFFLSVSVFAIASGHASEAETQHSPGSLGPDLHVGKDGNWELSVRVSQPVRILDQQGIDTAEKVAEERAKAAFIEYLDLQASKDTSVSDITTEVSRALASGALLSGDSARDITTTVRELIHSYASGELRGVTVLDKGYDANSKIAWVTIGISKNSLALSRTLQKEIGQ